VLRWRRWAILLALTVATGALGWFVFVHDEPERSCADVGLTTEASGSTPDDAMSAWVTSQGGDPSDWASGGERLEHSYHPVTPAAEPQGYVEVGVREVSPGVWRVTGACVN
jgi:hypothetical protein